MLQRRFQMCPSALQISRSPRKMPGQAEHGHQARRVLQYCLRLVQSLIGPGLTESRQTGQELAQIGLAAHVQLIEQLKAMTMRGRSPT